MPGMFAIFLAHNYYRRYRPPGENVVFEAETELLCDKGYTVYKYVRRGNDIADLSLAERAALSRNHLVTSVLCGRKNTHFEASR